MTVRKTIQWALVMVVAIVAAAGGGAYWVWKHTDDFLRQGIEQQLARVVPDWDVTFSRVHLDHSGRVRVENLDIRAPGQSSPVVRIPEMLISVDRELLTQHQQVVVERVQVNTPTIWMTRLPEGSWNWESLAAPLPTTNALPEFRIGRGTIVIRLESAAGGPAAEFSCRNIDAELTSGGYRRLLLSGNTDVENAGALKLSGMVDFVNGVWNLQGAAHKVQATDELLGLAAQFSPGLHERLAGIGAGTPETAEVSVLPAGHAAPANIKPLAHPSETRRLEVAAATATDDAGSVVHDRKRLAVAAASSTATGAADLLIPELGVRANVDLDFAISGDARRPAPEFSVAAVIHDGQITALPRPLYQLRGRLEWNNGRLAIDQLRAANGDSNLLVDGELTRTDGGTAADLIVQATNLEISRDLFQPRGGGGGNLAPPVDERIDAGWQRLYAQLNPSGRFNLDVKVRTDGRGDWDIALQKFTAIDCTLTHYAFPYPVTGVSGSITQEEGNLFRVELTGRAGSLPNPVVCSGFLRNPGPAFESQINVRVEDLPLDESFLAAFETERLQPVRRALSALALTGVGSGQCTLVRAGAAGEKFKLVVNAKVRDAALNCEKFPYAVDELRGIVRYDQTADGLWRFEDLHGRHGDAVLAGDATYTTRDGVGLLDLTVSAENAPLDRDLRFACTTALPDLETAWRQLSPSGRLKLDKLKFLWSPGRSPQVVVPRFELSGGSLTLSAFPYRWERVAAVGRWSSHRIDLESVEAWHGGTHLRIHGQSGPGTAYVEHPPQGNIAWHVHFEDVTAEQVDGGPELQESLPGRIGEMLATANINGLFDLWFGVDMKGACQPTDFVTAHWKGKATFKGNSFSAGVDLQGVDGEVVMSDGVWDGNAVTGEGWVNLPQARALDTQFTNVHGPFRVDGDVLSVGAPRWSDWFGANPPQHNPDWTTYANHQLRADVYDGRIGVDGAVLVGGRGEDSRYQVDLKLQDASLSSWAKAHDLGQTRLHGPVNGELSLRGVGADEKNVTGSGWLQISPAQLYELPVIAQTLTFLEFKPQDNTAFKYAYGEFKIEEGWFVFSRIDLIGDAISLVGNGRVAFAEELMEQVAIGFLSRSRNPVPLLSQIPGVRPLVEGLGKNWVYVTVRGTLDDPQTAIQPRIPVFDDAISGLLKALNAGQLPGPPRPNFPMPPGR